MSSEKRMVLAEDLYKFQVISEAQISPAGNLVVFVVQRVDEKNEKKYTDLWLANSDGSHTRQFTQGDHNDNMPRWSPDGQTIAFLSNRDNEKQAQIYLLPVAGGEARKLTDLQGSVQSLSWSPDGQTLLLNFRKKDADAIEREKDSQKKELGVVARHITQVFYKLDGVGYLPQEHSHIWTVSVATGEATQLTDGDYDENAPAWSPNGQTIVFTSNRHEEPDLHWDATELYTIPASGGDMTLLPTAHDKQKFNPQYSPDGQWIAYLGRRFSGRFYQNTCLYIVPASGGTAQNLTAPFDLHLSSVTINDIGGYPPSTPFTWGADSQSLYLQVTQKGNQPIVKLTLGDEPTVTPLLDAQGVYGAFSINKAGDQAAYFYANLQDPGQIWHTHLTQDETKQLSHLNSWLAEVELPLVDELWLKQENEADPSLQLWIVKPPNFDPQKSYPSILNIHGGPQTQTGNYFLHEMYYLASQGYVTYITNPRGSQGYGEDHAGAIHNQWGEKDYEDVMAITDYMAQQSYIDESRMGVSGGSYGGWMTTTIIGRTHRFKAAVAQRVVTNWISMWGSSDINWAAGNLFGGQYPWQNLDAYLRQSPIYHIKDAQTPTLIIHGEADMRCNQEQGEQLYVTLKRMGVDSELVLFPDSSHGLSRTGRTDRRIARLNHILRWFDKYLKD